MSVLCIGLNPAIDITMTLKDLTLGKVNRVSNTVSYEAGKAVNVASVLAQLGHRVTITGFLGMDNKAGFENKFNELGIDNACVLVKGATRQNIKLVEPCGRVTDINGKGFVVSDSDKQILIQKAVSLSDNADFVIVSGSLPVGFGLDDFKKLLLEIKKTNVKLIVDTSGEVLATAFLCEPYLVKPNSDELAQAFLGADLDDQADKIAHQQALIRKLPPVLHIVVSMGASGVAWHTKECITTATAPPVQVASTVGAGDTLLAGIVSGLIAKDTIEMILKKATAMATHSVGVVGVGIATNKRYQSLMNTVMIQKVKRTQ